MAIEMQQLARQEQRMVLTPQMQQAIHLLQVPMQELSSLIQQELDQNPLLEEEPIPSESPSPEETPPEPSPESPPAALPEAETEAPRDNGELEFKEEFDRLVEMDDEWKEYFQQDSRRNRYQQLDEEKLKFLEDSITRDETLSDHLLNQLRLAALSDREKAIGEIIIGNIDDNGYLAASLEEIARTAGAEPETVSSVLSAIQSFHPLGVGARNLRECLLIQLHSLENADPLARSIIDQHLDDLAAKKYPQIARALKTTLDKIQKTAEYISLLDPKPGRMFSSGQTHYISPDIYLEKTDEDYQIIFNHDYLPRLRISQNYRQLMNDSATDEKTRDYIKERVKSGFWLIKNIRLRQQTLYRITEEIVKRQREFLEKGLPFLRPLKMAEVAQAIGMHESTVSRAVANKYIQTPRGGTFQLKYFFSTALSTPAGTNVSATGVKQTIAQLVKGEDPVHPLSDQEILETLARRGIALARRTVAKYRKALNLLPSHLRKKF